ncbi:MAG: ABC transporter ATP-binding protein [Treponema sp.]|jgi:oligopeptide/dipeptide ABC transporter ATP-binding protein|nr:ABC transporter ATP-binding protein [Treponema sp.]
MEKVKEPKRKLLEVRQLATTFHTNRGPIRAVDGISFSVYEGEILGLVGESGCGKSVTSQSILRLYNEGKTAAYQGEVFLNGQDLMKLSEKTMRSIRGRDIAMVFQDALSSLNPVMTVGEQIMEPLFIHRKMNKKDARDEAIELLKLLGIPAPEKRFFSYPHELSGGMRQRVMIAAALACRPKLLIADEPTTALDVTIQAQIIDLLVELNQKLGMAIIFITHDLGIVAETCERVIVMYLGQIAEEGIAKDLFHSPQHPYTVGLLNSVPRTGENAPKRLFVIPGIVPTLRQIPQGCRFEPRCRYATMLCHTKPPDLLVNINNEQQKVRCWQYISPEAFAYG